MSSRSRGSVPLLRAPNLASSDIIAVFTTRVGGVSSAPFDTLNLGRATDDNPDAVKTNRLRVLEAMDVDPAGHVEAAQVHGNTTAVVTRRDAGTKMGDVDGLITADRGVVLAMHSADCVPVLFWDARRGVIAAAHAGWRGIAAGVVPSTVQAMARAFGSDPADLHVAMGPAIGPCHYEVGEDVARAFQVWPWRDEVLRPVRPGHFALDLVAANERQLRDLGVPANHIWASGACTACHPDLYFSYRRDRVTGRLGGLIALR